MSASAWPLVVYFVLVVALVAALVALSYVLGERHAEPAKGEPFESGVVIVQTDHWIRKQDGDGGVICASGTGARPGLVTSRPVRAQPSGDAGLRGEAVRGTRDAFPRTSRLAAHPLRPTRRLGRHG